MAVRFHSGDVVTETRHDGRVLALERYTYRVSSDNAMIDSGDGVRVTVWDDGRVAVHEVSTGRDGGGYYKTFDVDAGPDVVEAAAAWHEVFDWVATVGSAWRLHRRALDRARDRAPRRGDRVFVHKGRKVPHGEYWVLGAGTGPYGPYLHLSDHRAGLSEVYHRYVSVNNVRLVPTDADLVPPFEAPPPPFPATPDVLAAAVGAGERGRCGEAALAALADALLEARDEARAAVVRGHLAAVQREREACEAVY